jgi:putative NIF3 family GTP cyclohydrolase 1 type 2
MTQGCLWKSDGLKVSLMPTIQEITAYLDGLLDTKRLDEGLGLLSSGRSEVDLVCGAVNLSFHAIRKAVHERASLLLCHHAAWASTDADLVDKKLATLREHQVSLYVSHDSLDMHPTLGTAPCLARAIGWEPRLLFSDGLGVVADIPAGPLSSRAVAETLKQTLGANVVSVGELDAIWHIGINAGWGARPEWMAQAREAGADAFLSGEAIHFGKLYCLEAQLPLFLAGHYATELPAIRTLLERIGQDCGVSTKLVLDPDSAKLF